VPDPDEISRTAIGVQCGASIHEFKALTIPVLPKAMTVYITSYLPGDGKQSAACTRKLRA
jgi:hypothetical protein